MKSIVLTFLTIIAGSAFAMAQRPPLNVTVQPSEGEYIVYSPIAARSSQNGPTGQIALLLRIENTSGSDLRLNKITIGWDGPGGAYTEKTWPSESQYSRKDPFLPMNLPKNSFQYWHQVRDKDNDTVIYLPENFDPNLISIRLYCDGFSQPFLVYRAMKKHSSPVSGGSYQFPGKAKDLTSGEYWSTSSSHGTSSFGSQLFAYDMGVTGWNDLTKSYTDTVSGATGCANSNYRVYGKPVYAMADGEVVRFKDGVSENPMAWRIFGDSKNSCPTAAEMEDFDCSKVPQGSGGGNYISIKSGDELHGYAHLQKGSLNPDLLRPGAKVKVGDKLGVVGNSGCSTAPHLHFETLQIHNLGQVKIDAQNNNPANVSLRPLIFNDIYTIDSSKLTSRDPQPDKWKKVNDRAIPRPFSFIWASNTKPCYYNPDRPELAVHGIAEANYQGFYEQARTCGYRPVWVDGFEYNDKNYYNAIFRYEPNRDGYARHKQTFDQFNKERQELEGKGYRILFIDSYQQNAKAYFSTIYVKDNGPETKVTARLTAAQHDAKVEEMNADGWKPIQVSAFSSAGLRLVTTLYQKRPVGSWSIRSHLSASEFDAMVAENQNKGLALVHVNAYLEFGYIPRFAAVWHEKTPYTSIAATRKLWAAGHQTEYDKQRGRGLLTRVVTGYEQDNKMAFAAVWTN